MVTGASHTTVFSILRVLCIGGLLGTVSYAHADEPSLSIPSIVCGGALGALFVKLTTLSMKPKNPETFLLYLGTTLGFLIGGSPFSLGYLAGRAVPSTPLLESLSEKQKFHDVCAISSLAVHTFFVEAPKRTVFWKIAEFGLGLLAQKLVQLKLEQEEKEEGPIDLRAIKEHKT